MQFKPQRKERVAPPQAYAAVHKDENIRLNSSSGGAFSALASAMLKQGGVVCGAAYDEQYSKVRHIIIEDENDMPKLRTSKYVQSDMRDTYEEVKNLLKQGRNVLFSGTPCQVSGLHLFLRKEYENLVTIDIVCHGVPSPVIYQDYIKWLENKNQSKIISYNFRDKQWSWYHFNMKAVFSNGSYYLGKWEEDPYFRGFLGDWFLRESCYKCSFSQHTRYSDITLSDFWGYKRQDRGLKNDDKGISMCLPNTQKGKTLLTKAFDYMNVCTSPLEAALTNGGFKERNQTCISREVFFRNYKERGFEGCLNSYFSSIAPQDAVIKLRYRFGRNSLSYKLARMLLPALCRSDVLKRIFNNLTGTYL